jgi:hypothetical protein
MYMGIIVRDTMQVAEFVRAMWKKRRIGRSHAAAYAVLLLTLVWPAVGCNENGPLIPDPAVRYIAFGDSETSGRSGRSYPEILTGLLGAPAGAIANHGRDGETTGEGLDRLRQLLSRDIYPNAQTLLYWEGGADIIAFMREVDRLLLISPLAPDYPYSTQLVEKLDRTQANIEAVIAEGRAAGLTVYVATYFSLREATARCDSLPLEVILPAQARSANGYVSLLNERIRQAAINRGAALVDITAANDVLQADDSNFVNCNHLSEKGNEIVAHLFFEALDR